jgi:hypothetical protein
MCVCALFTLVRNTVFVVYTVREDAGDKWYLRLHHANQGDRPLGWHTSEHGSLATSHRVYAKLITIVYIRHQTDVVKSPISVTTCPVQRSVLRDASKATKTQICTHS